MRACCMTAEKLGVMLEGQRQQCTGCPLGKGQRRQSLDNRPVLRCYGKAAEDLCQPKREEERAWLRPGWWM